MPRQARSGRGADRRGGRGHVVGPTVGADRAVPSGAMGTRPVVGQGVMTSPAGGRVEYRLARNAVIAEYRRGRLSKLDVCDAHPELVRAARHIGATAGEVCPICGEGALVEVTFVFGARLPSGGRCVTSPRELERLRRRKDPVVAYVVEVCPECAWNHLVRMDPSGATLPGPAARLAGDRSAR